MNLRLGQHVFYHYEPEKLGIVEVEVLKIQTNGIVEVLILEGLHQGTKQHIYPDTYAMHRKTAIRRVQNQIKAHLIEADRCESTGKSHYEAMLGMAKDSRKRVEEILAMNPNIMEQETNAQSN